MSTNTAPFTIQPRLTQIAMAIKPEGMIADEVCPRVPVPAEKFIWTRFTTEEMFTIPDTRVGRTSEPNTVEFGGKDVTESVEDHGLDDLVPNKDINAAAAGNANYDPMEEAAANTAVLVELAREKRVADLYFSLGTYDPALRTTLSGTGQWSDYDNSDPVPEILAKMDLMLVRPTDIGFGQAGWTVFRQHPKVVAAVLNRTNGMGGLNAAGYVTRQAVADLLEIRRVHVGAAFSNASKKGQAASYVRLWGKHCAMWKLETTVRSARSPMPSFGFTAQFGERVAGTMDEPKKGLKGSTLVRVGEQVKELIAFQQCGYFWQNAFA